MTNDVNPNNGQDADDFYDDATAGFPKAEHLAPSVPPKFGPGRLVAIWARENGKRKNDKGEVYPFVDTITVTLDDGPDGDLTGPGWSEDAVELVPPGVQRLELQHSTGGLVARLSKRVEGVNAKGIKLKYRPMIGRINTQASKNNKNVAAFSVSEPTDEDRSIVDKHREMIIGINQELEAKDKAKEDEAAFDA
jgi:hypothetical protein